MHKYEAVSCCEFMSYFNNFANTKKNLYCLSCKSIENERTLSSAPLLWKWLLPSRFPSPWCTNNLNSQLTSDLIDFCSPFCKTCKQDLIPNGTGCNIRTSAAFCKFSNVNKSQCVTTMYVHINIFKGNIHMSLNVCMYFWSKREMCL